MTRSQRLKRILSGINGVDTQLWPSKKRSDIIVAQRKAFAVVCVTTFGDTDTYEHIASMLSRDHSTIAYYMSSSHWLHCEIENNYRSEKYYYQMFMREAMKIKDRGNVSFNRSIECKMLIGFV